MGFHFFAYVARMKFIKRWGLMRNTIRENDMEHSFQVAMIAHAIALIGVTRYGKTYSPEHIMALGMYHDASEVITGDLPTPIKHNYKQLNIEYKKIEESACLRLLSMLPDDLLNKYTPLIMQEANTEEHKIVKAADKICAYIKCIEEDKMGNFDFSDAKKEIENFLSNVTDREILDFIDDFLPSFSLTLDKISK